MSMSSGILRTWNDERGFGFIAPTQGGRELFVHISAFPQDGSRPTLGETLQFELGAGKDGKPQAVRVRRMALMGSGTSNTSTSTSTGTGTGTGTGTTAPSALAAPRPVRAYPTVRSEPVRAASSRASFAASSGNRRSTFWRGLIVVLLVASLCAYGYKQYRQHLSELRRFSAPPDATEQSTPPAPAAVVESFRCDGRTHCSQMNSCAEATYFLRNCPGVKMDGDHDGVACEEQWCGVR
jgi:cold shock CspA family protein